MHESIISRKMKWKFLILNQRIIAFPCFLPVPDNPFRRAFDSANERFRVEAANEDGDLVWANTGFPTLEKPQSSSCLIRRSGSLFRPRNRFPLFFRLISRAREIRHQRPQSFAKKRAVADEKGGNKGKLESDVWIDSTIPLILIRFEVASAETTVGSATSSPPVRWGRLKSFCPGGVEFAKKKKQKKRKKKKERTAETPPNRKTNKTFFARKRRRGIEGNFDEKVVENVVPKYSYFFLFFFFDTWRSKLRKECLFRGLW